MTSIEMLACILLVASSAYLSASEIAIFSLSRFQLRYLKDNFRLAHRRIKRLLSDPSGLLVTTLVLTEILNIGLSTLITRSVSQQSNDLPPLFKAANIPDWALETIIGTVITAPIVLIFCEI